MEQMRRALPPRLICQSPSFAQVDRRVILGQIKQARGFRQFMMRGLNKFAVEWAMLCTREHKHTDEAGLTERSF